MENGLNRMKTGVFILLWLLPVWVFAQYPPPAGETGSTAIHADSSLLIEWASSCTVIRGWQNIADTLLGETEYGSESDALGKADNKVVSLGDGGTALLRFEKPITNGDGWDFAVFENGFNNAFLELAFVEVSSDGQNFFRFPAVSLTQTATQVPTFGMLEATKIHNLAGKYKVYYGTPFDLNDVAHEPGLNVNHIIAVRLVDVVGSIDDAFATYDDQGNKVNDPWPTPFETGGFDLDAVGVIHNVSNTGETEQKGIRVSIFPNPARNVLHVRGIFERIVVSNPQGRQRKTFVLSPVELTGFAKGLLIVRVVMKDGSINTFKVVKL